ncbi:MAG: deoxyguanosinetriphosphate triphosphohydrolase [Candidatus Binatia bacterium]
MLTRRELAALEDQLLAPYAMPSAATRGREHPEPEHPLRLAFQRDRDRIIHSTAFRRLEYKTQVFVNHEGDYYRTRLTHTMEAAQITRTIAKSVRLNSDLAEAVALAHDLGHTPFGHAGERVLNELMADHGGFEHNAQSLRIVDVLEERYPDFPGLNLTWELREGIVKHTPPYDKPLAAAFESGAAPCLEAQLVDYTDEIAYNSHDIDDGLKSGLLTFEQLDEVRLWREAYGAVRQRHPAASPRIWRYQAIRLIIDRLVTDLIEHVERRVAAEQIETVADVRAYGQPVVGFGPELEAQRLELKRFLMDNLYRHHRVIRVFEKAKRVMRELFDAYMSEPQQLPPHILERRQRGETLARIIADYIAGMTDRFALEEHRKLFDPFEKG